MSAAGDHVAWLRRAAAACERVGVVDRSGRLVNMGKLIPSANPRRVDFLPESSPSSAYVWLDEAWLGQSEFQIVPVTPAYESRWGLVRTCRETRWSGVPDAVLESVASAVRQSSPGCLPPGSRGRTDP